MKLLRWDNGRQLSGYSKMLLATSKLLKFDCYLLRVPQGCAVPPHTDPAVPGYGHHRVNIQLNRSVLGTGKMLVEGPVKLFLFGRAAYFRPDLYLHWMTPGDDFIQTDHNTYILTIGWLRREAA